MERPKTGHRRHERHAAGSLTVVDLLRRERAGQTGQASAWSTELTVPMPAQTGQNDQTVPIEGVPIEGVPVDGIPVAGIPAEAGASEPGPTGTAPAGTGSAEPGSAETSPADAVETDLAAADEVGGTEPASAARADAAPLGMAALVDQFVDDPTVEIPPRHGWIATTAKATGLAFGSLVLCGSVLAAASLAHSHRTGPAPTGTGESVLTGVNALRPDDLAAQLTGHHFAGAPGKADGPTSAARGRAVGTITGVTPSVTPQHGVPSAAPATATSAVPGGRPNGAGLDLLSPLSPDQVVRSFYDLVTSQPAVAAALVDPALLASDPIGFTESWSDIKQVDVESTKVNPDGTVEAVINLRELQGGWLRIVELLQVTGGNDPVISGAELLSAQRG